MASNGSSSELESRISAIVENSVGRMRDELVHRMQDTESRLRDIDGRLGGATGAARAPEPTATEPTGDAPSDLFDAVVAMDRGSSQQEVLAALLEGIGRFAGRAALFLTRSDEAVCWGSYGFEDTASEIQGVALSSREGPMATLAEGKGCVPLTGDESGELCRQMGASPGAEGLLVPFVLRDSLAAALYVDRFADDPPLRQSSLQLLAYVGAQAVEGLALRQRSETPTLQVTKAGVEAPGVAVWEAPAAARETPAPEQPAAEPQPPEQAAAEPQAPGSAVNEPPATAPQVSEPQLTGPEETIDAPPAEMTLEPLAEEVVTPELPAEDLPVIETDLETADDDGWDVPAVPTDEPEVELEPIVAAPAEEITQPLETPVEPAADTPIEEPPAEEAQPWAATAGTDLPSVATEPAEITPPAEGLPSSAPGETTQVSPPTDVSGPGWAFTASRTAAESGDDAQHEEARRLARLLVTEIKLYNEEQVEEGRRGNDIYPRLREDIDRSRQIFNERVDDAVRQETDYFQEEMVRILAGGDAEALGL